MKLSRIEKITLSFIKKFCPSIYDWVKIGLMYKIDSLIDFSESLESQLDSGDTASPAEVRKIISETEQERCSLMQLSKLI